MHYAIQINGSISGVLGGGGTPPLVKPVRSGGVKNRPFFRSRPRYENPWSPIGGTGGGPPPGGGGGAPPPELAWASPIRQDPGGSSACSSAKAYRIKNKRQEQT